LVGLSRQKRPLKVDSWEPGIATEADLLHFRAAGFNVWGLGVELLGLKSP